MMLYVRKNRAFFAALPSPSRLHMPDAVVYLHNHLVVYVVVYAVVYVGALVVMYAAKRSRTSFIRDLLRCKYIAASDSLRLWQV